MQPGLFSHPTEPVVTSGEGPDHDAVVMPQFSDTPRTSSDRD